MNRITQTRFGTEGNCFQACIASIMEMPLDEVPDFVNKNDAWRQAFEIWLQKYGLSLCVIEVGNVDGVRSVMGLPPTGWCIILGPTDRGFHAVVGWCCESVVYERFDPHPSRNGLQQYDCVISFGVMDPVKIIKAMPIQTTTNRNQHGKS
jgi:hypothetical protein